MEPPPLCWDDSIIRETMHSKDIIHLIKRTLNLVDYRIVDHCERVAFIVSRLMQEEGKYSDEEIAKSCLLAAFHDIGAYKTEDFDSLSDINEAMLYENDQYMGHAVYGYLFLKNFFIFGDQSDAILYHHCKYSILMESSCNDKALAAKIFLADKIDLLFMRGCLNVDENFLSRVSGTVFSPEEIGRFVALEKKEKIVQMLEDGRYMGELSKVYDKINFSHIEKKKLLLTAIYSLGFKSEITLMHVVNVVNAANELAKIMGLSAEDCEKVNRGALLHDLGKIACSSMVLEKSGPLDDHEFSIMQEHISVTEAILTGLVDDDVYRIAVRHHEKLDGSGYPNGLVAEQISVLERIVCVADIASALMEQRSYKDEFPEVKVRSIFKDMMKNNKLDTDIVNLMLENYTEFRANVRKQSRQNLLSYNSMYEQYEELQDMLLSQA